LLSHGIAALCGSAEPTDAYWLKALTLSHYSVYHRMTTPSEYLNYF
jgi:hypothetical protein